MPGRRNRVLQFLAIALIVQGALSSAWAASRCTAMEDCGPQASSPCPMGPGTAPCEGMSGDCGQGAGARILCEEGCARVFSEAPAVPALSAHAPGAFAAGAPIVLPVDAAHASLASGAPLAPSSRGRPALWLSTHSLLI